MQVVGGSPLDQGIQLVEEDMRDSPLDQGIQVVEGDTLQNRGLYTGTCV